MFLRAVRGGTSSHTASTRESVDTRELALQSSAARTICCFLEPGSTALSFSSTCSGPRIPKRGPVPSGVMFRSVISCYFYRAGLSLDFEVGNGVQSLFNGVEDSHLFLGQLGEDILLLYSE